MLKTKKAIYIKTGKGATAKPDINTDKLDYEYM